MCRADVTWDELVGCIIVKKFENCPTNFRARHSSRALPSRELAWGVYILTKVENELNYSVSLYAVVGAINSTQKHAYKKNSLCALQHTRVLEHTLEHTCTSHFSLSLHQKHQDKVSGQWGVMVWLLGGEKKGAPLYSSVPPTGSHTHACTQAHRHTFPSIPTDFGASLCLLLVLQEL